MVVSKKTIIKYGNTTKIWKKNLQLHINKLDDDKLNMKIVSLDEMYNFSVDSLFIWDHL